MELNTDNQMKDIKSEACVCNKRTPINSLDVSGSVDVSDSLDVSGSLESCVSSRSVEVIASRDDQLSAGESLRCPAIPSSIAENNISEELHSTTSSKATHQTDMAYELNIQQNEWTARDGTRSITREEILALRQALDEANSKAKRIEQHYKDLVIGRACLELRRTVFAELKEAYKELQLAESEYEEFLPKFLDPRDVEEFDARSKPEF